MSLVEHGITTLRLAKTSYWSNRSSSPAMPDPLGPFQLLFAVAVRRQGTGTDILISTEVAINSNTRHHIVASMHKESCPLWPTQFSPGPASTTAVMTALPQAQRSLDSQWAPPQQQHLVWLGAYPTCHHAHGSVNSCCMLYS